MNLERNLEYILTKLDLPLKELEQLKIDFKDDKAMLHIVDHNYDGKGPRLFYGLPRGDINGYSVNIFCTNLKDLKKVLLKKFSSWVSIDEYTLARKTLFSRLIIKRKKDYRDNGKGETIFSKHECSVLNKAIDTYL